MKKNLVVLSFIAALTLMAASGAAATSVSMRVSVPFDFYAGDVKLPAGEYSFKMGSGFLPTAAILTLRAQDGTGIWIMATQAGIDGNVSSGQLQFNRYGDKNFLSSVSIEGFKAGVKAQKLEKELRSQTRSIEKPVLRAQK